MSSEIPTNNTDQLIRFDSREQAQLLTLQLIQQAKRQICFFGANIDPVLFDNTEVINEISMFARRSDKTIVKIAVHSSQQNISAAHRLLPLAQKLTSSIKLHSTAKQHHHLNQLFLLIDQTAYLYCQYNNRYEGRMSSNDPAETHHLQQIFDDIWTHSSPDLAIRRLHL